MTSEEAQEYVREFFDILDTTEESDSGHIFHPVYISSCRVLKTKRLEVILGELRKWSGKEVKE